MFEIYLIPCLMFVPISLTSANIRFVLVDLAVKVLVQENQSDEFGFNVLFIYNMIRHLLIIGNYTFVFLVEKNSIQVTPPDELKGKYECAIRNFGCCSTGARCMAGSSTGELRNTPISGWLVKSVNRIMQGSCSLLSGFHSFQRYLALITGQLACFLQDVL